MCIYTKVSDYDDTISYIEKNQSYFISKNEYWGYRSMTFVLETHARQLYVYANASVLTTIQGELMAIKISE